MKRWLLVLMFLASACGNGSGDDTDAGPGDGGGPDVTCAGLRCQQATCTNGVRTTVTGTVYTPAGGLPLPNVHVFVPNAPLAPFPDEITCDRCDANLSGDPIVRTRTDALGRFSLIDVPAGANIPLVIQTGRWRRLVNLPSVSPCATNPVDDTELLRLPRNQAEGDLPRIALTTGGADALECLLRKLGVSDSEFTTEDGTGRVHLYAGHDGTDRFDAEHNAGASFTPAPEMWDELSRLQQYDVVVHSCEGRNYAQTTNKSADARLAFLDYVNGGGRVFMSHWHHYWLELGPDPLPSLIDVTAGLDDIGDTTALVDTSFEKGRQFADWLLAIGASSQRAKLPLVDTQHSVTGYDDTLTQRWIYTTQPSSLQYLSANTPVGASAQQQCGRMVVTDMHVASGDSSDPTLTFPSGGCTTTELLPQEKALIYMLFDLSACIEPDLD